MPIDPRLVKWDDVAIDPSKVKWDKPNGASGSWDEKPWLDVPLNAVKNSPSSAINFVKGIYQAVRHPIDTAGNIADLAAGGLQNAVGAVAPGVRDFINNIAPSDANQRTADTAGAVWKFYKDRYGSEDALKNTLSTDPVGAAADLSTVLSGGAMLAPKGGTIANVLQTGAKYTNPLSAVGPVIKGAATAAAFPVKHVMGMAAGVGGENISQSLMSGLNDKKAFYKNMSGETPMTDVLDLAKQNLQTMAAKKSAQYRSGMVDIKGDKSVLNFDGIDKSLQDAANTVTFKGQIKNSKGANVVQAISDEIAQWKGLDPAEFHTPEGLDALKQKIGAIVEGIPFEEKTARMVGNKVYASIKGEITQQAPTYAKVMKDYAEASDTIKEIERALSLGQKASADTAMRKLQSLTRNNVNTNYGNRLDLAKTLEAGGGNEILPSIAGQAMSSWTPRGLAGLGGPATLGVAALGNPYALAALPFQSPRTVGTLLYGTGQGLRPIKGLLDANPLTTMQMRNGGLLLNQAGRLNPGQD